MLRTHEGQRTPLACQTPSHLIRNATYLLVHIRGKQMSVHPDYSLAVTEEICLYAVSYRKHIIIKIQIFFSKSFYPMKMHLYRIAIECRQEFFGYDILMQYYLEIFRISPLRDLRRMRNNQKHIFYKGHPGLNTSQKILQGTPVPETFFHYRNICKSFIILLPHRVVSVYVGNYCIHLKSV